MRLPLWIIAWILIIELLLILVFVPGEWTERVIKSEQQKVERALGRETRDWVYGNAARWYSATFVETGIYRGMHQLVVPSETERARSAGMEDMGSGLWPWVEDRLGSLMHVIYQVFARISLMLVWSPYMIILLLPAIWDGMMSWKIKRTNFDYASPIFHRYGSRSVVVVVQLLLIAFFAPVALNPMLAPVAMMVICLLIGVSVGNFQKRV